MSTTENARYYQTPSVESLTLSDKIQAPPDFLLLNLSDEEITVKEYVRLLHYWIMALKRDIRHDSAQIWLHQVPSRFFRRPYSLIGVLHMVPLILIRLIARIFGTSESLHVMKNRRMARYRAKFDAQLLVNAVTVEWRTAVLERRESPELAAKIIRRTQKRVHAIAESLKEAETAQCQPEILKKKRRS